MYVIARSNDVDRYLSGSSDVFALYFTLITDVKGSMKFGCEDGRLVKSIEIRPG